MSGADRFHVPPARDTLYDALGVAESVRTRHVRKVATAIRRDRTTADDLLHDVCLAQEVLGDPALRAEYDALLARVRATGEPLPRIGTAIEGARLGPSVATQLGRHLRTGAHVGGQALKVAVGIALAVALLVLLAIGLGSRTDPNTYAPIRPIEIPEIRIPPPTIDYSKLYIPPPPKLELPALDLRSLEPPPAKPPRKPPARRKQAPPAESPTSDAAP